MSDLQTGENSRFLYQQLVSCTDPCLAEHLHGAVVTGFYNDPNKPLHASVESPPTCGQMGPWDH